MEPRLGAVDVDLLNGRGTVRVGTSGWSYPSWVGPFYPPGTSAARMLPAYAERFSAVEAHSTHRRLPTPAGLARWVAHVPAHFRFAPKAHIGITHRRDTDGLGERVDRFLRALEPLGDRLGPVLFVLPHRRPDLARLDLLLGALAAAPLPVHPVFELAPGWRIDEVRRRLETAGASLAVVDRDEDPGEAQSLLGPVPYVRLRRPGYTALQLAAWAARLAGAAGAGADAYAFVKHDERGDGPRYARELVERLDWLGGR